MKQVDFANQHGGGTNNTITWMMTKYIVIYDEFRVNNGAQFFSFFLFFVFTGLECTAKKEQLMNKLDGNMELTIAASRNCSIYYERKNLFFFFFGDQLGGDRRRRVATLS